MTAQASRGEVVRLDVDVLRRAIAASFRGVGLGEEEAFRIADSLTEAEVSGVPTHGLLRLPWYLDGIRSGLYRAGARITVINPTSGVALVDGGGTLGYLPTWRAVDVAVTKAQSNGIGAAAVRNIGEFGRAAYYAIEGARRGVVCVICQNTVPLLGPPGCRVATHGNNPLAFTAPGADAPIFDAAFTPRSGGELRRRALLGLPLPPEWGYVDGAGNPTTDPIAAVQGVQPAIGGAKGFGVALLVDLLAGILAGASSGQEATTGPSVGAMVLAFDPEAFGVSDAVPVQLAKSADLVRSNGGRWPGDRTRADRDRCVERGWVEVDQPIFDAAIAAVGQFDPDPRLEAPPSEP